MMASPTVQMEADQFLSVDTKTNNDLRKARQVVELQTCRRFTLVSTAVALIVVEVQGTRTDTCLAAPACWTIAPNATATAKVDFFMYRSSHF